MLNDLEKKILKYQKSYYDGNQEISDSEFDQLWNELEKNYPDSVLLKKVGSDTVKNGKIKHIMVMGSQSKFNTREGLEKWIESNSIEFPIVCEEKIDGNSLELQYENGRLKYAVTRGDGYYGEDVTNVALNMKDIPNKLESYTGAIRGEIVMYRSVFESKYSSNFKNPRNLVAGLMKNEKFRDYDDLVFIAYDCSRIFDLETSKLDWISRYFTVPKTKVFYDVESLMDYRNSINSKSSLYDIDGLVLKQDKVDLDDLSELRPKKSHAFKWIDEGEETTLIDVEWSNQGYTFTPVAVMDPIELKGATVKRASLANPSLIENLKLKIGDKVLVTKRGQIIPKIEKATEHCGTVDIKIPKICPYCGEPLVLRDNNTKLYCENEECITHLSARLSKWINVLDVKGFGDALQKFMVEECNMTSICDLYKPKFKNLVCSTYGSINAEKAFNDLYSKRNIDLATLIAGFNIEGIGLEMSKTLTENGYDSLESLHNVKVEDLEKLPNWSSIRAKAFIKGFNMVYSEVEWMASSENIILKKSENKMQSGLKICVTGKLENFTRKSVNEYIMNHGCTPVDSVNSSTNILVTNDPNSGSSKNKNAIKRGVKIISEKDMMEMLEK